VRLADLRAFGFGLDGCIWAGLRLLPGAKEVVALRWRGKRVLFLTNSSRAVRGSLAVKLNHPGIERDHLFVGCN
jgi:arabinose operon protein AraL